MSYDQSRKRLRYLNEKGLLKRYRKDSKSQTVYYIDKILKEHNLKIMDVIVALQELNIGRIELQKKLIINRFTTYIADAVAVIDHRYPIIWEVDYTHYTSNKKITDIINYLECRSEEINAYLFLIVRQTVEDIEITNISNKGKLIYVNWDFNNSDKLIHSLRSLFKL
jgi:hypothetical protein